MSEIKYYVFIEEGEVNGYGCSPCTNPNIISIEVNEEVCNNISTYGNYYYIYENNELIINPNYEQEYAEKEAERINNLTMTALDFIGVLEYCGLDYVTQIKPFLESQPDLDKQLKYCQNVYCGVAKSVMPITVGNVTITAEMVERAFRIKNGEEL